MTDRLQESLEALRKKLPNLISQEMEKEAPDLSLVGYLTGWLAELEEARNIREAGWIRSPTGLSGSGAPCSSERGEKSPGLDV